MHCTEYSLTYVVESADLQVNTMEEIVHTVGRYDQCVLLIFMINYVLSFFFDHLSTVTPIGIMSEIFYAYRTSMGLQW